METLQFKTTIKADVEKVYHTMLGEETFKQWTGIFHPTSRYEGNWDKGSKIKFIGEGKDGKQEGMVGIVRENKPSEFVSVEYIALVDGDKEVSTGPGVAEWLNTFENYTFENHNGETTVTVDIDMNDEMIAYFNEKYPQALNKLKEICER
jgi:uncharacterized protein YndB with AHSA1/START domain